MLASVHFGVVKHDERVRPYCKGEPVKEFRDAFGCHAWRNRSMLGQQEEVETYEKV